MAGISRRAGEMIGITTAANLPATKTVRLAREFSVMKAASHLPDPRPQGEKPLLRGNL